MKSKTKAASRGTPIELSDLPNESVVSPPSPPVYLVSAFQSQRDCVLQPRVARNELLHGSLRPGAEEESRRDSATKPRVARNELPWVTAPSRANPERVEALYRWLLDRNGGTTLSGLRSLRHRRPRVARSSQPWALLRNPFGIPPPHPALKIPGRSRHEQATRLCEKELWRCRLAELGFAFGID